MSAEELNYSGLGLTMKTHRLNVARLDFVGGIPPKFERQLCRREERYAKKVTTAVLYKDETFL